MSKENGSDVSERGLNADDYIEIQQLYARYAFTLDTGDGDGRARTFTEDGTFSFFGNQHQAEPVNSFANRTKRTGNRGHRHLIFNIIIEASAEGATGGCHCVVLGKDGTSGPEYAPLGGGYTILTGFYQDKLVRTPGGWRFKARHVFYDNEPNSPFAPGEPPV